MFTADTGASRTIISRQFYEEMAQEDKPILSKTSKLVGASGVTINELGKGTFYMELGPVKLEIEAIVAEIEDEGLLGVDVSQNGNSGPSDLIMSKDVLKIDKQEVLIIQIGITNRIRKVTAADHFVIPAQSECIIEVYVERQEYDDFSNEKDYIIYPLQMASTLVDINQACICKVRVLNPFPTAMSIKQDAVIGKAEPAECIPVIVADEESKQGVNNFNRIRSDFLQRGENMFPS